MCSYQILNYHDLHGYIVYCNACHYLQLGFGCMQINFSRNEFRSFMRVVNEIFEDYMGEPDTYQKSIRIPTPCESLSLYLSLVEIRVLYGMIEDADTELTSGDLIKLCEG